MATASRVALANPRLAVAMRKCDRRIDLTEHETSGHIPLTVAERDALSDESFGINITPVKGKENVYTLRPGSIVGALDLDGLSLYIEPKVTIQRLLYLASYAMGAVDLRKEHFDFEREGNVADELAWRLGRAAADAFARGLWHDYRVEEEALHTVRGRIMVAEQIRRRFDMPLPVEVRYDEYTEDVLANRLIKAAARLLRGMRLSDARAREGLRHIDATLANVSPVRYPPHDVPEVKFTRLNDHYRDAVAIARLVLRYWFHEAARDENGVRVPGFLMDMNVVFQQFVTRKLREVMGASENTLRSDKKMPRTIHLAVNAVNEERKKEFLLKPDLSWWDGGDYGYTFVGDAKYKRIDDRAVQNADIYQALAYATAFNLPGAVLAYAKGEAEPASYHVCHADKRIEVVAVDLEGDIDAIDQSIKALAERVRCLRAEGRKLREAQREALPQSA